MTLSIEAPIEGGSGPEPDPAATPAIGGDGSRQWRSLWRIHFYSGMFAIPFILLMAVTGLVILYTQPIQDALQGDQRLVAVGDRYVSYDQQEKAVEAAYPGVGVISMTVPPDDHHATIFGLDDGRYGREVYVDPYTGKVLGSGDPGGGVVGLANRLHGYFNNDTWTISLPAVSALWDGDAVIRPYVVGDLILEILGVWTLVLIASGLYLWMPRRSRNGGTERNGRRWLSLRLQKKGRARWRDLHGLSGLIMLPVLGLTILSGMAWSTYWGPNFAALADKVTPSNWEDAPDSALGDRADLDRLGNHINWNTGDIPIPASYATPADGAMPVPLSLDSVAAIGAQEGMLPGYTISFPKNATDDDGALVFGSFTMANSWPRKTGETHTLALDQFTGDTLSEQGAEAMGVVSRGMDTLVSTHMGTQLGLIDRVFMTVLCLLAIWSSVSALVMFTKRRRPGTLGLPRRPVDLRLGRKIKVTATVLGVMFPQWAATALIILGFDRFVIRKVPRLRTAFGQR